MDEAAFAAWLGVKVEAEGGLKYSLTKPTIALFEAMYKGKAIDEDDVYLPTCKLDETSIKVAIGTWMSYYEDGMKAGKGSESSVDRRKLTDWLRARFLVDEASSNKDDSKPTAAALEDMAAHGASELWQLGFVELGLATGRAASRKECDNYAHRAPWSTMTGGRNAIKFKERTLDDVLAVAAKDASIHLVEVFFTELSVSLCADKSDAFALALSTRVLQFWQKTTTTLRQPSMIVSYLIAFRRLYRGRGLPVLKDEGLMMEAMTGYLSTPVGLGEARLGGERSKRSADEHSESGSSLGPSASQIGGNPTGGRGSSILSHTDTAKFEEQLSSVLDAVTKTSTEVASLTSSVGRMQSNLDSLGSRVRTIESWNKPQTCSKCGSTSHLRASCPVLKREEEERKAAAKKD